MVVSLISSSWTTVFMYRCFKVFDCLLWKLFYAYVLICGAYVLFFSLRLLRPQRDEEAWESLRTEVKFLD